MTLELVSPRDKAAGPFGSPTVKGSISMMRSAAVPTHWSRPSITVTTLLANAGVGGLGTRAGERGSSGGFSVKPRSR